MTIFEAAQLPLRRSLVFSGRSNRQEFWSFLLATWIVLAVVGVLLEAADPKLLIYPGFLVPLAAYLALWAVAVRRLHDTNHSGFALLVALIPLLGLLVLLLWFAEGGNPGVNRYGPNPAE